MNVLRIRNEMRNGKTIFDLPLRVTFYARVSTDKDEQLNSLENQVQYYTHFIDAVVTVLQAVPDERDCAQDIRRMEEDLSALRTKKDRLLEMSIEGVISRLEFKQRNDGFNQQAQALEGRLPVRAHRMACGSGSGVA